MNILLMDDDHAYRSMLEIFLEEEGWTVYQASNSADGFERLRKTTIDCIICDLHLPVLSGPAFHDRLRTISSVARIPILFVSDSDEADGAESIERSSFTAFISKFEPLTLLGEQLRRLTTASGKKEASPAPGGHEVLRPNLLPTGIRPSAA